MRFAFATHQGQPQGTDDDALAIAAVTRSGASVVSVPWSRSEFDWSTLDAVVVRSCWDYHVRLPEFLNWIAGLEASGVPVLNAPALIRWNARKTYLRELEAGGVAVVPTRWVAPGAVCDLARILTDEGWTTAVVKPVVGASSHQTVVVRPDNAQQVTTQLLESDSHTGFLVQPFVDQIAAEGEWSLMFFGDRFSHSVLKRPGPGDFRVQMEFNGTADARKIPTPIVEQAQGILHQLSDIPLYARVDGVVQAGCFVLMELELIEPDLFLRLSPDAANQFAGNLLDALKST